MAFLKYFVFIALSTLNFGYAILNIRHPFTQAFNLVAGIICVKMLLRELH